MGKLRWLVLTVVTLLTHGCPIQAVVEAFILDERMVAGWQKKVAAERCWRVHEHLMKAGNAWSFRRFSGQTNSG